MPLFIQPFNRNLIAVSQEILKTRLVQQVFFNTRMHKFAFIRLKKFQVKHRDWKIISSQVMCISSEKIEPMTSRSRKRFSLCLSIIYLAKNEDVWRVHRDLWFSQIFRSASHWSKIDLRRRKIVVEKSIKFERSLNFWKVFSWGRFGFFQTWFLTQLSPSFGIENFGSVSVKKY